MMMRELSCRHLFKFILSFAKTRFSGLAILLRICADHFRAWLTGYRESHISNSSMKMELSLPQ